MLDSGLPLGEKASSDWELFLLRLRYRDGRLVEAGGNKPIMLDDPEVAWVVYTGSVNVFALPVADGAPAGARRHLFQAGDGAALFGTPVGDQGFGLLMSAAAETKLLRLRRSGLVRLGENPQFAPLVAALIDGWVENLGRTLVRALPPRDWQTIEPGATLTLAAQGIARRRRDVVWITVREGTIDVASRPDLGIAAGAPPLPLASTAWLTAQTAAIVEPADTTAVLGTEGFSTALAQFNTLAVDGLRHDAEARDEGDRARIEARERADQAAIDAACIRLSTVLAPQGLASLPLAEGDDPLLTVCRLVARPLGLTVKAPARRATAHVRPDPLREITRASRIRYRQVALRGDWWRGDSGPLVAYRETDDQPVALLPASTQSYVLYDPVARTSTQMTNDVAATLKPFAYAFYRHFEDRPLSGRDLIAFWLQGTRGDLATVIAMAIAAGLLGLLTPVATGIIFDTLLPTSQHREVLQIGAVLVVSALATLMFHLTRSIATVRVTSKIDLGSQAALIDRLLELPASFFRRYTAGDLANRSLAIALMWQLLSQTAITAIVGHVFTVFSLGLLFAYNAQLALVGLALVVAFIVVVVYVERLQLRHERAMAAAGGKLSGTVLQLINGIAKFRVAGAEQRAFGTWAKDFAEQRLHAYRVRTTTNTLMTFNAAYPVLSSMVIFGMIALSSTAGMSIGSFMAFNTAFAQLIAAAGQISLAIMAVIQAIPLYERAQPILQAVPEVDATKADPGEVSGALEVHHVSFRYREDAPLVLDDVSLQIRPGEFVALVGPSGSGKSTLLRLLLGFEKPSAGAILYDGQDLASLDVGALRRQVGSVLQNGRLMTGDIFTNIVGSAALTLDDAWEAARLAGFDEDVKQMPMGMHTVISEGGGTLSGGQRQRLLIARSIVHKPRILFFDEATSALDNRTQEIVQKSLEGLAATRVVIAHRLSTIINADRIYVMQGGRTIQSGTYRELSQRRGLFADLARRQMT